MTNPKPPLDILIITAVRDEFDAVLRVNQGAASDSQWITQPGLNGRNIAFRTFEASNGPIHIGVTYATDMGQTATTEAATALINTYNVRCLAMCGVCAGRRGKVNLGDVIIADRVWDYDLGKMVAEYDEDGKRHERILGDLTTYQLDPAWKQAAEGWQPDPESDWLQERPYTHKEQSDWVLERVLLGEDPLKHPDKDTRCADWSIILQRLWDDKTLQDGTLNLTPAGRQAIEKMRLLAGGGLAEPTPFQVHVGPIGAGSQVVEDAHIFDHLAQTMRKVLGLEMESPAIGAVQHSNRDQVSKMLVMKAVQDFADPDKNDNFRAFAARASAECLIGFLREVLSSVIQPDDGLLNSGISDPPDFGSNEPSPSAILNPSYQIAPFFRGGREDILADLEAWRLSETPVAVRIIHGPGGIGKTRLMIECLKPLQDSGWQVGFLRESTPENWFERLMQRHEPLLVVIDYAESRAKLRDLLMPVLQFYQETRLRPNIQVTPVRIVLLSRQIGDWWDALNRKDIELKTLLNTTPPHELKPLATSVSRRDEIFSQAALTFAGVCRCLPPTSPPIQLADAQFDLVLYLHMAALAAVKGWLFTGSASLMETILDHEARVWAKQGAYPDDIADELWIEQARQWVVAATLLGGLPSREAALALGEALFKRSPNELDLHHLHRIYPDPGGYLAPLLPDLLGEGMTLRLIEQVKQRPQDYIARLFTNRSGSQVQRGFEVLGRIGVKTPQAVTPWIQQLLGLTLANHTIPAYIAARSLATKTAFSPLAAILCEQLDQGALEDDVALSLAKLLKALGLPNISVSMKGLIEWVSRIQLQNVDHTDSSEAAQAEKARQVSNQSVYQSELGQREAALVSAQAAVDINRQLSEKNPDAFLPDLAMSLNNLGTMQSELGQREAALASTQAAVDIYQPLSEKNPDAFLPALAMSLNNLGAMQRELGQREAALASAQAAVDIYQPLSEKNPDAFLPDLAMSLNNLGNQQSDLGQREAALASTQAAVDIRRQLSKKNPDAFLPDLAMSLSNLGNQQSDLGQREAALASTQAAVDIDQQLSEKNPDAFLPVLADSLNNLGNRQSDLGQREAALASTQAAVDIRKQLSKKNPDAFLPVLADSLNNLGAMQSKLGQHEASLASTQAAVDIRQPLSEKNPDAFLPGLAMSLNNLGGMQSDLGQHEAALVSIQAASNLYWPFFQQHPQAFARNADIVLRNEVRYLEALNQQPSVTLIQRMESIQKHLDDAP